MEEIKDIDDTHTGFITMEWSPKWNYVVKYLQKLWEQNKNSDSKQLKLVESKKDITKTNERYKYLANWLVKVKVKRKRNENLSLTKEAKLKLGSRKIQNLKEF